VLNQLVVRRRKFRWIVLLAVAVACSHERSTNPDDSGDNQVPAGSDTAKVAINDLGTGTYKGFRGGLYPDGTNVPPSAHVAVGVARAKNISPLNANGIRSASGKIVLLSIGMSNTSHEFCGTDITVSCWAETFMGQAAVDPAVNKSTLTIVNGAQGGMDAQYWTSPTAATFDVVRDDRLKKLGVTERQVQVVWLKEADAGPHFQLPEVNADAYALETRLGSIVRALKARYPNLQQVFVTSRSYAGYATSTLNPEPYAYESGFSVKWLIQAQIDQMRSGSVADTRAGDLNYDNVAPWIAWGPYPWANGTKARSDGLQWQPADFMIDGTHPSASGRAKIGAMLLSFFKSSQFTACWFLAGSNC
jgi:hypothetical protein